MSSERRTLPALVWLLLLAVALCGGTWCLLTGHGVLTLLLSATALGAAFRLLQMQHRVYGDLQDFREALRYRDFSRRYNLRRAPAYLRPLREGFNEIGGIIREVTLEKERQFLYLQQVLELVDTGILSFDTESGEVRWMNEALRRLLKLPYLRSLNALARRDEALATILQQLVPGETRVVTSSTGEKKRMLLSAALLEADGRRFKLVAFQAADEVLNEAETKAWQQLLSVLTHELMNSIAPISSLAQTLRGRLRQRDETLYEDLELGIDTIENRSRKLLQFAETYRNLGRITSIDCRPVAARELFSNIHQLLLPSFEQKGVEFETVLRDPSLTLLADAPMLEQVLINLLLNALEAVKEAAAPRVVLSAEMGEDRRALLRVSDNGCGIPPELQEQIFVPFFTTRKNGNGIGLSLCKQIVTLHKGSIQVRSQPGQGTQFLVQVEALPERK